MRLYTAMNASELEKLENLAVYGRACMGESWLLDYYRFAFSVLEDFSQLLTHGQKFDPESLYEPIEFETLYPYLVNKYQF